MYVARILYPVRVLGPGERIGIWFEGCCHHCEGCSNPELWQQRPEHRVEPGVLEHMLRKIAAEHPVDGFTLTGGDPFYQPEALEALLPLYESRRGLRVLDLGSGVGRNAIACARALKGAQVTCVDILPMAIEKLRENAESFGVSGKIKGISAPVDGFSIEPEGFDLILAGSVLEHLDSKSSTMKTLNAIQRGIRPGGGVMIVMNTGIRE